MTPTRTHCVLSATVVVVSGLFVYSLGADAMSTPAYWIVAFCFTVLVIGPVGCLCALGLRNRLIQELARPAAVIAPEIDEIKVAIVVPAKLLSSKNVDDLLQRLQEHFQTHRGGQRYFGILSDFRDAPTQTVAGEEVLLARAVSGIEQLNARYGGKEGARFFLLHRPRAWSTSEQQWMGYERKRGKLLTFNEYVLSGEGACYSGFAGPVSELLGTRYVITLDEDNRLAEKGAQRLIAAMVQSEQQLTIDVARRVVCAGHAILQPLIRDMPPQECTRYQRLVCSGSNAVASISWVYLWRFGQVPFAGKGIYRVKTFQEILAGRFPDGRVLSHDILEGCYLRCGLVTHVNIVETPSLTPFHELARQCRWMRGDVQNLSWSLPTVPDPEAGRARNPLTALCRWRITVEAARNLAPFCSFSMIVAGLFVHARSGYIAATAITLYAFPCMLGLVVRIVTSNGSWNGYRTVLQSAFLDVLKVILHFLILPTFAWSGVAALVSSSWRIHVSGHNLLQWTPSAWLARAAPRSVGNHYAAFLPNVIASILLLFVVAHFVPSAMITACGFAVAWLCAPLVSWWLAGPWRPLVAARVRCRLQSGKSLISNKES